MSNHFTYRGATVDSATLGNRVLRRYKKTGMRSAASRTVNNGAAHTNSRAFSCVLFMICGV